MKEFEFVIPEYQTIVHKAVPNLNTRRYKIEWAEGWNEILNEKYETDGVNFLWTDIDADLVNHYCATGQWEKPVLDTSSLKLAYFDVSLQAAQENLDSLRRELEKLKQRR